MKTAFLTWESLLLGAVVWLIIFWMRSGINTVLKKLKCKIVLGKTYYALGFVVLIFVCNGLI
jgi:hypothetical protein